MRLLYLTGIGPTSDRPEIGIYITRRLVELKKAGLDADSYMFRYSDTPLLAKLKEMIGLPSNRPTSQVPVIVDGIMYRPVAIRHSFVDALAYLTWAQRCFHALEQTIDLNHYDLIHAHWGYPEGYVAHLVKENYGIPFVLTLHGSDIHSPPPQYPKLAPLIYAALESADRTIFVSNGLLEIARKNGYRAENARVIPNGVDLSMFRPMERDQAARHLGVELRMAKTVGFIGKQDRSKGADHLPKIFSIISASFPEVRLIAIGDGPLRSQLEESFRIAGLTALFPGHVRNTNIPYWLNLMDVLILPSLNEGFGCVLLEAQACGVPVVGSDRGGIPEAVGSGGSVVPFGPRFDEEFAEAVVRLLRDPPSSEQLRSFVANQGWSKIVREEIDVYREIVDQCGSK